MRLLHADVCTGIEALVLDTDGQVGLDKGQVGEEGGKDYGGCLTCGIFVKGRDRRFAASGAELMPPLLVGASDGEVLAPAGRLPSPAPFPGEGGIASTPGGAGIFSTPSSASGRAVTPSPSP